MFLFIFLLSFLAIEEDRPETLFDLMDELVNAEDGDIIEVPRGIHVITEQVQIFSKNLIIKAKPPADASSVIIDFANNGPGFFFWLSNSTLEDLTFINAYGPDWGGAILLAAFSNAEIKRCVFKDNQAVYSGAAIYLYKSHPLIENCVFEDNRTNYRGGALYLQKSNPVIKSTLFFDNRTTLEGGAIYADWGSIPSVENCTIVNNLSKDDSGGLHIIHSASTINSTILWGNQPNQVNETIAPFEFCNIQHQIMNGISNISIDPLFIDDRFHIDESSPCVDMGDPTYMPEINEYDLDGNPRLIGLSVDIGSYEVQ